MTDSLLSIRVETAGTSGRFVWVIMELRAEDEAVEIAASLRSYKKPSEALYAAETVLRSTGLKPTRDDRLPVVRRSLASAMPLLAQS